MRAGRALADQKRIARSIRDMGQAHAGIQEQETIGEKLTGPFVPKVGRESALTDLGDRSHFARTEEDWKHSAADHLVRRKVQVRILVKCWRNFLPDRSLLQVRQNASMPGQVGE